MTLKKALKSGLPFRRPLMDWYFSPTFFDYFYASDDSYALTTEDVLANDWETDKVGSRETAILKISRLR